MIVRDTEGTPYRLTDKWLRELHRGHRSALRYGLAVDLQQLHEHFYVIHAYYKGAHGYTELIHRGEWVTWPIDKRGWIFPKVTIGCRTFRGDYARAILRAAKDA